jgi:predicted amidohydrolase
MIIASAQTSPKRGNTEKNLNDHYRLIKIASENDADLILFPEMSITGYEREKAKDLSFEVKDNRLKTLCKLSEENNIIVVAGAPIEIAKKLYIGCFVIKPYSSVEVYVKHYLHTGEEQYFSSTKRFNPSVKIGDKKVSFAICADIDNPKHPFDAYKSGCDIYMPGIFFSPSGISNAYNSLSGYAKKYKMNVLMSNFCKQSWGKEAAGQSAFWNSNGELVAKMNSTNTGLLLAERNKDNWVCKTIYD